MTKMVRIMKMIRKLLRMTRMMKKKKEEGDSYLCFAAWAEGKPGYRGVPFLSQPTSQMSQIFLFQKLSSPHQDMSSIVIVI